MGRLGNPCLDGGHNLRPLGLLLVAFGFGQSGQLGVERSQFSRHSGGGSNAN